MMTDVTMNTKETDFWNRIAPKYAEDPIADMAAYEYTLGRTISYLKPTDTVLELGAGTGATALQIAPHVRKMVSTDLSDAMIAIAQSRKAKAGLENLHFEADSVAQVLQGAGNVDVVLGFNLFHLLPDMERQFQTIVDRLPEGGFFISKTPCLADRSQGLLRFALPVMLPIMRLFGKAPYVRRFTEATLERAIERAGFDIVEAGNFPARARYIVARKR